MQVCNLNCICTNSDCAYKHFIDYKERKIVKRFYNKLNVSKPEEDYGSRNANCTYGQLCNKSSCGYRHRISFEDREKLIISYKYYKICPEKDEKPVKVIYNKPTIEYSSNLFASLEESDNDFCDDISEDNLEVKINVIPERKWADAVINNKIKKIDVSTSSSNWEDLGDDDYLMTF
jgi:hypothetical protein